MIFSSNAFLRVNGHFATLAKCFPIYISYKDGKDKKYFPRRHSYICIPVQWSSTILVYVDYFKHDIRISVAVHGQASYTCTVHRASIVYDNRLFMGKHSSIFIYDTRVRVDAVHGQAGAIIAYDTRIRINARIRESYINNTIPTSMHRLQ